MKENHILILCWVFLWAMVTGYFGTSLGIPYLFLDPEYLNEVNFTSFFIMGSTLSGFTIAFQITCYINDGHRFSFVGTLRKPFMRFALNNSTIPIMFMLVYVYHIIYFQTMNQYCTTAELLINLAGLFSGISVMALIYFLYLQVTNKNIFQYVVCQLDEKLKQNVRVTRAGAMKKLGIARKKQIRVDHYFDFDFRFKKVDDRKDFYDRQTILQVFDQNHLNLVILQLFIFLVILVLAMFKDQPAFQIPAASSVIIFLTILIMLAGAFSYWFGSWSGTAALIVFVLINYLTGQDAFYRPEKAFGLNYSVTPATYSIKHLKALSSPDSLHKDKIQTLKILNQWRQKFPKEYNPKMVFITLSGGGKRAALWALTALQAADSLTEGKAFEHTMLITGSSGGLIGGSYFREIKLRKKKGETIYPYSAIHQTRISTDNLNPLIFSFLSNGLFVGMTQFEYAGKQYVKDRAFTFEEDINETTGYMMDKTIASYKTYEANAIIPMMIVSPTISNDGRKLYISSQSVRYMNEERINIPHYGNSEIGGIDFRTLFTHQDGDSLRFLSALRMNASFPYITPNTVLPTSPPIEIIDAGVSDNVGLSTTVRFVYTFRNWIAKNTSGIVLLSVRDSPKITPISPYISQTLLDKMTQPISSVYNNLENFQDIQNDMIINYAPLWLDCPIERIDLEYQPDSPITHTASKIRGSKKSTTNASLSWRLTRREKESVVNNIYQPTNQVKLEKLKTLLH